MINIVVTPIHNQIRCCKEHHNDIDVDVVGLTEGVGSRGMKRCHVIVASFACSIYTCLMTSMA